MDLAAEIRARLARRGLTQRELASRVGLSRQAFSNKMNGHTDFTVSEVIAVADSLGTTVVDLLARAEAADNADVVAGAALAGPGREVS